jgi:hypothetical protein
MSVQSAHLARQHQLLPSTALKVPLAATHPVARQWFNKSNHADLQMLSPFLKNTQKSRHHSQTGV